MIKVDADVIAIRRLERHVAYGSSGPLGHPISIVRLPMMARFLRQFYRFEDVVFDSTDIHHIYQMDGSVRVECWQCFECHRYFFATEIDGLRHECTGE